MKTVNELLRGRRGQVLSISPDAKIFEALALMADKDVGALLVMEGPRLVGIVSERDYARKVVLAGKTSRDTPVREIMTERVVYVTAEETVDECLALMTEKRVRHLPVLEGERVAGVLSIGDLVKEKISEQEFIIVELEKYIMG